MSFIAKAFAQIFGTSVTYRKRVELDGAPQAGVSASGGSLGPGTYYYRVTAIVDGVERGTPRETKVVISSGNTNKVDLTWTSLPSASQYKVYRSSSAAFPSPSLLASVATNSYSDTGAVAPSAGSPPAPTGDPIVDFQTSSVKAVSRAVARVAEELRRPLFERSPAYEPGYELRERRQILIDAASGVTPSENDQVQIGSKLYRIFRATAVYGLGGTAYYELDLEWLPGA